MSSGSYGSADDPGNEQSRLMSYRNNSCDYGYQSGAGRNRIKSSMTAESDLFQDYGDGRKRRHSKITAWEASWNINNSIQGMFIVGFPYAIVEGGYWALASILAIGATACYTGRILVDCLYEIDAMGNKIRVRRTYSEVAAHVFGSRLGPALVNFSQLAELLMTCTIYLVLCGDLFSAMFPSAGLDIYTWILISGILVFPYSVLHNIKHLAWISAACMAVHVIMMVAVIGYCLTRISDWQVSCAQIFSFHFILYLIPLFLSPVCFAILVVGCKSRIECEIGVVGCWFDPVEQCGPNIFATDRRKHGGTSSILANAQVDLCGSIVDEIVVCLHSVFDIWPGNKRSHHQQFAFVRSQEHCQHNSSGQGTADVSTAIFYIG